MTKFCIRYIYTLDDPFDGLHRSDTIVVLDATVKKKKKERRKNIDTPIFPAPHQRVPFVHKVLNSQASLDGASCR